MDLSVVVPVFNEAEIVAELVDRSLAVLGRAGGDCELIVVDDASTDGTAALLEGLKARHPSGLIGKGALRSHSLAFPSPLPEPHPGLSNSPHPPLRVLHLQRNRGQFQATCEGIRTALGRWVVVMDGDLQDPPEVIADLLAAWHARPGPLDAVYAVKTRRDDAAWMRWGSALYAATQRALGVAMPQGAGSFCLLRADIARTLTTISLRDVNLAAALSAYGVTCTTVGYAKAARRNGPSRVGAVGLVREAIGSLLLSNISP